MKFSGIRNWFPMTGAKASTNKRHISSIISAFQFTRLKHDALGWRDAIVEAENAFYPHRVKMQRVYQDTPINGHVHACLKRRNDLVLLKDFALFSDDKKEKPDDKATDLFKTQWFYEFLKYALEAKYYGYSLIELGDLVDNKFPDLRVVRRENISPDRLICSPLTYGIHGESFMDPSNEFYDWTVYVDTPSDKGTSICGYGLLYKVALYEIYLRNLLGSNANYNDKYGQPTRHAKTAKTEGAEYDALCAAMDEMGENGWLVTDLQDEIELIAPQGGAGQGFKTYDNFETRLEKKISKVILGHSDALDSTPGKLGGNQDGEKSAVAQALEDIETTDARDLEYIVNDCLIPKLIKIGFPVSPGLRFGFKNDKEKEEIRQKKDASNKATADYVKILSDAGYEVDEAWLTKHIDIPLKKKEAPEPLQNPNFSKDIQNKLNEMYGRL